MKNIFFIVFSSTVLVIITAYVVFLSNYIDDNKNVDWVNMKLRFMEEKSKNIDEEKVIILAGSNGAFGIDSSIIEQITGRPTLNLSTHAAIDLTFYVSLLKRFVSQGDIVVLPLEYAYYEREKMTSKHVAYMSSWGGKYLDVYGLLSLLTSASFNDVVNGKRLYYKSDSVNIENLTAMVKANGDYSSLNKNGFYFWENLNKNGDFLYQVKANDYVLKKTDNYLPRVDWKLSEKFKKNFDRISTLIKARKAKLILTYPTTMKNLHFDLNNAATKHRIALFNTNLSKNDIKIYCDAAMFHFDKKYFLDTQYHLNSAGAKMKSENLAKCINGAFNNKVPNMDTEKILLEVSSRQSLLELEIVNKALQEYYIDHGKYPISKGFDGVFSKWGKSDTEWISGLIPNYIDELPRDPRNSNDPNHQYLYKSDGENYKLISHGVKLTSETAKFADPKRLDYAFGFWTKHGNW